MKGRTKNLYKLIYFKKKKNRFPLYKGQALFCWIVKSCFRKKYKYT